MFTLINELIGLQRNQWLSRLALERVQNAKLRCLVEHAYNNIPMYKSMFDSAECQPEDIKSVGDLTYLPVVTKADIQGAGNSAFAQNIDLTRCVWLKTSGSDGSPLSLPFTKLDKARRVLKEIRALLGNGYMPTDRMMLVVEPRCVVKNNAWFQKMGLLRRKCLSIYSSHEEQLACLREWKPQVLYGYTSGLHILADEVLKSPADAPTVKLVITSAELLEPIVRRRIEKAFGVVPTDFYGSMEFGWIAWECPEHKGYHINSDCLVVECLKDGCPVAPGEEGEFVITNLYASAAPMIRYATGDVGTLAVKPCRCGRSLPLISSISGRLVDRVVLPTGEMVSPYVLTCAIEDVRGVKQFQLVQESAYKLSLNYVPTDDAKEIAPSLMAGIRSVVGESMEINVRPVDGIDREKSGKLKVVKSELGRTGGIIDRIRA